MTFFQLIPTRVALFALLISLLVGCGSGPYADLSNSELQEKYTRCENADTLSPGGAITCDNVRTECDSRAEEKGRKICY